MSVGDALTDIFFRAIIQLDPNEAYFGYHKNGISVFSDFQFWLLSV
jgi:hypothetical protein